MNDVTGKHCKMCKRTLIKEKLPICIRCQKELLQNAVKVGSFAAAGWVVNGILDQVLGSSKKPEEKVNIECSENNDATENEEQVESNAC